MVLNKIKNEYKMSFSDMTQLLNKEVIIRNF